MGDYPMVEAFRETVGQPFAVHFELIGDLEDQHGYDVMFQPETSHYGLTMFAQKMFLDGEEWNPVGSGYRECRVVRLWHLYGFQGESRVVLELTDDWTETGYDDTFEVESFNVLLDDIEELYSKITHERTFESREGDKGDVPPAAGGCWFCHRDDGDMYFDMEFDTYYHQECLDKRGVDSVLEWESRDL